MMGLSLLQFEVVVEPIGRCYESTMAKSLFVRDLRDGTRLRGEVFVLLEKQLAQTREGSLYLKAVLGDRTGRVEVRYWDVPTQLYSLLEVGTGVQVDGTVTSYPPESGELQIHIDRITPIALEDLQEFLPHAKRSLSDMVEELGHLVGEIKDPHLLALLDILLSEQSFRDIFFKGPAAKMYHHACIGGLLEHSLAVANLCRYLYGRHPELNRDLLLTAALLHDVGKVSAYESTPGFNLTDEGRLVGHVVQGALIVNQAVVRVETFPSGLRVALLHAILAHHGAQERGSPVTPKTLEALALHHADWLDGDLRGFMDHVQTEPVTESEWTRYSRMFRTELYRGFLTREEDEVPEEEIPF